MSSDLKEISGYVQACARTIPEMPAQEMLDRLNRIFTKTGFERVREAARIELEALPPRP